MGSLVLDKPLTYDWDEDTQVEVYRAGDPENDRQNDEVAENVCYECGEEATIMTKVGHNILRCCAAHDFQATQYNDDSRTIYDGDTLPHNTETENWATKVQRILDGRAQTSTSNETGVEQSIAPMFVKRDTDRLEQDERERGEAQRVPIPRTPSMTSQRGVVDVDHNGGNGGSKLFGALENTIVTKLPIALTQERNEADMHREEW